MAVASETPASFRSSAIRPGPVALVRQGFEELLSRRRLIRYLVQTDLKKKGSDTLLGNVWWVLDPLLQMLVYVVLVTVIFDRAKADYPLFIFCAILPWKWFNSSVIDGISSVVGMERLIKQIAFPKLVLPVASVFSGVANFFFGMIPLAVLILAFYRAAVFVPATATVAGYEVGGVHASLVLIPAIAGVQLLMTLPVAIVLAAINVFYRDVGNLARHVLRLAFYVSPGIYDIETLNHAADKIPAIKAVILLNPWTTLFTAYRDVIYYGRAPEWSGLILLSLVSLGLLALAILFFKRVEPTFAKVL